MNTTRLVRVLGLLGFLLLNLALAARPSQAGYRENLCIAQDGEVFECCEFCLLCWKCTWLVEEVD